MIVGGVPVRHLARPDDLREPGDLCYSLGMDKEQTTAVSAQATVEIAQGAVSGLIEAFKEQYESGAIDDAQDAMRWLEAYQSGVMAVRF